MYVKIKKIHENLYDNTPIAIFSWVYENDDFTLDDYNKKAFELTDGNIKQFIGKQASSIYHDQPEILNPFFEAYKTNITIKKSSIHKRVYDGQLSQIFFHYVPVKDKGIILYAENIDEKTELLVTHENTLHNLQERIKELNCLYNLTKIIQNSDFSIETILEKSVSIIPQSFQFPEIATSEIIYDNITYKTEEFKKTKWQIKSDIIINDIVIGFVIVYYTEKRQEFDEGPFLKQERDLINTIANLLSSEIEKRIISERNIKETIEYDKKLEENHRLMMQIFNFSTEGLRIISKDFKILYANDVYSSMIHTPISQIINKNCRDFLCSKKCDTDACTMRQVLKGNNIHNQETSMYIDNKLKYFLYNANKFISSDNKTSGIIESFVDITSMKENEKALKLSEERFRAIFENSDVGIVLADTSGHFIKSNNAFSKITGYSQKELMDITFQEISINDDLIQEEKLISQLLKKEISYYTIEKRYRRKDNSIIWAKLTVSGIYKKDDEIDYLVGIVDEITNQKIMEENLIESKIIAEKANRAKSDFLANMSHELRTPLNAILGFSQILQMQNENFDLKHNEYISYIRDSGDHLLSMVNDILDLSKIESGKTEIIPELFNIEALLNRITTTVEGLAKDKSLEIDIDIKKGLSWFYGDEVRIKQILYNLLSNAVKFSENENTIGIIAKEEHDSIIIKTWDHGRGISPENLERIFQPFEQAGSNKNNGTGLGLAISKKLIELHGGTISVSSILNEGSTFTITLPNKKKK